MQIQYKMYLHTYPNILDTHKEMAQIHSRFYYPITIGKRTTLEPYTFNMGKRSDTTQLYGNKRRESAEKFNQIQNFDSHYQQMSRPRFEHGYKNVPSKHKISTNKFS